MMSLAFSASARAANGRNIREACFKPRSTLTVSAACVVANGIRETLAAVLCAPVSLRLLEPLVPDRAGWDAICGGALLFRSRGSAAEAAFVLRPADASALAFAAFGEPAAEPRALSPVENEVLLRAVRTLCGALAPVCGADLAPLERILDISGYATYFELLIERPVPVRLGVALSRDPACLQGATLRLADLLDVEIELTAEFAGGYLPAAAFLDLRVGADVPMMTRIGEAGLLKVDGLVLARGECGSLRERSALFVSAAP